VLFFISVIDMGPSILFYLLYPYPPNTTQIRCMVQFWIVALEVLNVCCCCNYCNSGNQYTSTV